MAEPETPLAVGRAGEGLGGGGGAWIHSVPRILQIVLSYISHWLSLLRIN